MSTPADNLMLTVDALLLLFCWRRRRWEYCHEPAAGTPEAEFLDAARHARNWV
jgi:coproporphyrinogen III oxidase